MTGIDPDDERARRRARRAFVASHHPDRGGDPAAFAEGLAAFDERPSRPVGPRVRVVRSNSPARVLRRLLRRLQGRPPRTLR